MERQGLMYELLEERLEETAKTRAVLVAVTDLLATQKRVNALAEQAAMRDRMERRQTRGR